MISGTVPGSSLPGCSLSPLQRGVSSSLVGKYAESLLHRMAKFKKQSLCIDAGSIDILLFPKPEFYILAFFVSRSWAKIELFLKKN